MIQWWERIDRKAELAAVRGLVPRGGCLIFRGDNRAGREQMARLAAERLGAFGRRVVRADPPYGFPGVKQLLVEVWKQVHPVVPPGDLPPWAVQAASLNPGMIAMELAKLAKENPDIALVLDEIDSSEPWPPHHVPVLARLSRETRWPVVAASVEESHTDWSTSSATVMDLRDFTAEDLREVALSAPELAEKDQDELEREIALITRTGTIRPFRAYLAVRAMAR